MPKSTTMFMVDKTALAMRGAFLILLLVLVGCQSDTTRPSEALTPSEAPVDTVLFDAALAEQLGADAYGMKSYVMAFLKAGPNRSQDSLEAARLQQAHLNNISRMAEEGLLVLAGPFLDDGELRGIYIFDVATIEEAEALTNTDPAVQAGRLEMELHPWYGSAALLQMNDLHTRIQESSF